VTGRDAMGIMWLVIFPALFAVLCFCVCTPGSHRQPPSYPQPFSCASEMASLAAVDGGGTIAPLCGATPYPTATP
jgi:hypothetical protein